MTRSFYDLSCLDKGNAFEKFTVLKFSKQYYKILECRSDKCFDGRYPETNKLPDLVLQLHTKYNKVELAVECNKES